MSEAAGNGASGMKLHTKILLGLLIGGLLGIAANTMLGPDDPTIAAINKNVAGPIGQIFLRMLFMIVVPLIFASIALGVAGIGDVRRLGRVGAKTLGYYLVTTLVAAAIGVLLVSAVRPGEQIPDSVRAELLATYAGDASSKVEAAKTSKFGVDMLVGIVTNNPLKSAVEMDLLGLLFFGLIFGAALTMIPPESARPMINLLQSLQDVVIKIVDIAMRLAPFGVTALIFGVTSRFGWSLLVPLGAFAGVVLGGLLIQLGLIGLIVKLAAGLSPRVFFSRCRSSLVTAFSTSSSAATLPTNFVVAEQNLGIPRHIAGFVLSLGNTMGSNGTALFEGVTVLFLAQVFGIDLTFTQMIVVMIMAVITATGVASVPGGSIPLIVGILLMFGIPAEGIAIVLGIDRILDMSRTVVNVVGDLSAACVIARSEGAWSPADIPAVVGPTEREATLDESPDWPLPR